MIARVKSHCQKKGMTLIMAVVQCTIGKPWGCGVHVDVIWPLKPTQALFFRQSKAAHVRNSPWVTIFFIMCHVTPSHLDPWAVWAASVVWQRTLSDGTHMNTNIQGFQARCCTVSNDQSYSPTYFVVFVAVADKKNQFQFILLLQNVWK